MKKLIKNLLTGIAGLFLFCIATVSVWADSEVNVVEKYTTENGVVLYVKGLESFTDEVTYQVGTTSCTVDNVTTIKEAGENIYTLVLWDNSVSVMKKCETDVKDILKDVVANRVASEYFAIATIGEEITYLTDYTDNYTSLKQVIDGVKQENKDAYMIENLYAAIEELNEIENSCYKRIILISDGMDSTEIGYTKSELDSLIAENPYPIYTIGVLSGNAKDELQNMFALSRTTHADYFYLDEVEDLMNVVEAFADDYSIQKITATVPESIRDGGTPNSQLSFTIGEETIQVQCQVEMPFLNQSTMEVETEDEIEVIETEAVETEIVETEIETELEDEEDEEDDEEIKTVTVFDMDIPLVYVIGACIAIAVIIVIIIIVLVILSKRKKSKEEAYKEAREKELLDKKLKNERNNAAEQANIGQNVTNSTNTGAGTETRTLLGNTKKTVILQTNGAANKPMYCVTLTGVVNSTKSYQYKFDDKIIVGRNTTGCQIMIADDPAVSGRHCEIGILNGKFYAKDLGSSNGTFINSHQITVATEISTGCIIKIGSMDYRITIE